jgi:hypothetical protein
MRCQDKIRVIPNAHVPRAPSQLVVTKGASECLVSTATFDQKAVASAF